jgi:alkyldihydroxyacetonephosphate synthase
VDAARLVSERMGASASSALGDRIACSRDLWQRRLIEVQHGAAFEPERLPAAVVRASHPDEIAKLLELARAEDLAVVPFGAGSAVTGAVACDARTVVLDTKRLSDFVVEEGGAVLSVGPGALGITLEERLAQRGYTLGHFPSSILCSTVGGWVAARGAGQCSGRYGKIEDMVVSMDAVLGGGDVLTLHRRPRARDLTPLLIGSEGTLGVLTRLRLRLHRAPAARAFGGFELPDMERGADAMRCLYQAGLRPSVARLYDPLDSMPLGDGKKTKKRRGQTDPLASLAFSIPKLLGRGVALAERLFLKRCKLVTIFEGEPDDVRADLARAEELVRGAGGTSLGEGIARHWFERRYAVSYRQQEAFHSGAFSDTLEVAAPWSRLSALYRGVHTALERHALVMAHMSHAYPDGCSIYFTFVARPDAAEAVRVHETLWRDALDAALAAGGTISHHHGVGRLRGEFLARELGAGGSFALAAVKRACDPRGILCPGTPLSSLPVTGSDAPAPALGGIELDALSELVRLPGHVTLRAAAADLRARGHTLLVEPLDLSVRDWVRAGLPGLPDPFADPVEQRVAGFEASFGEGRRIVQRPVPRRALGPDPFALFAGSGEFGAIDAVWVRAPALAAAQARPLPFGGSAPPAPSDAEDGVWQRLEAELSR